MPQNKILIIFSHPLFEKSHANKALVKNIPESENITFHDLYEEYPDFDIDVKHEQWLLTQHDIIIWHHPMYWYSCPPLMKQWIDMVLEHGWAYGRKGKVLQDKIVFQVITTGGDKENYCETGRDRYTIPNLLEPFNQTAKVCNMQYLPPFVVHGTHNMTEEDYHKNGLIYGYFLEYLENNDLNIEEILEYHYMNEWFATIQI
ncbi:NAD(P)H-dependent oxidoreductase [Flavobacterium sp. GT3R68]|uniref:NAD(P)H-dependent oxidoreductase n=1 Tax=Flavobacterium sp. GT3R68 TaxID=2594437 RepID=UPI000F87C8C7|nr:NAD(P)H-dependent oxidoreductase [Flavobacterium sp. GT3R68]RTY95276.1 NAD(P)H oxidoreductase [Flavobacterium sp. GSN2]TRW90983.1 NAD(P)H oxidoreductase [Flavobacterium sp. GT3R68]